MKKLLRKNIKYYRQRNDMTQKDLADKLGVAATTISAWENGHIHVSTAYFDGLARIFEIDKAMLLGDEESVKTAFMGTQSKPFIDQNYRFNKPLFGFFLVTVLFTVLAPLFEGTFHAFYSILWILYIIISIFSFIRNYKKQYGTKYYHEGETLYYSFNESETKRVSLRKDLKSAIWLLFLSINIAIIFPFELIQSEIDDVLVSSIYLLGWLVSNGILVYILYYEGKAEYSGKDIDYDVLNVNFYLGRYRFLFMIYSFMYVFHFLLLTVYDINPYQSMDVIAVYVVMTMTYLIIYFLLEQGKRYYSHYHIKVKKQ